ITGEDTKFFRPPYIAVNPTMYEAIDMPFICGAGCNDWEDSVSAEQRAERTLNQVKDGTIVLLHDMQGNSKTVEALKTIIPELQAQGYEFVTVSELFEAKGIEISADDTGLYTLVEEK
ncbi:MAG: polysaccharide deacetylase, partial [Huintestinicola sp.]